MGGLEKIKKGNVHKGGWSIEGGGVKAFVHYYIERLKGGTWRLELLGGPNLKGGTSDPSSYHDPFQAEIYKSVAKLSKKRRRVNNCNLMITAEIYKSAAR